MIVMGASPSSLPAYERPEFPFSPAAGDPGSDAIPVDDPAIIDWATAVVSVFYGAEVAEEWRVPGNAVGPGGQSQSDLLVLGRGGEVVLEFSTWIKDGEGHDFVVFENAFSDTFLELAFIEVSSDGQHFVRFPAYALTAAPVPAFGEVLPTLIHGLAGKYRTGYGTPFDLKILEEAYLAAVSGTAGFSESYARHLIENFPGLDRSSVRFVRIIDIPGDGTHFDCEGFPIYDPYPTAITAGFDLDAVGVINPGRSPRLSFAEWSESKGIAVNWGGDPDRDRWSNALEYMLGSDPSSFVSKPVFEIRILPGTGIMAVVFELNPLADELPSAEISRDGVEWESVQILSTQELFSGTSIKPLPGWGVPLIPDGRESLLFRLKATR